MWSFWEQQGTLATGCSNICLVLRMHPDCEHVTNSASLLPLLDVPSRTVAAVDFGTMQEDRGSWTEQSEVGKLSSCLRCSKSPGAKLASLLCTSVAGAAARHSHTVMDYFLQVLGTDTSSSADLRLLAAKARVILNCVGPYRYTGEAVACACAEVGTDLLDISGEPGKNLATVMQSAKQCSASTSSQSVMCRVHGIGGL